MLRAFILAFNDGSGRDVGEADGRVGFIHVLTAGARGAEGIDPEVGRVDLDLFDFML